MIFIPDSHTASFQKLDLGKCPPPGRFELSKGIPKRTSAMALSFETLNSKFCELKSRQDVYVYIYIYIYIYTHLCMLW